MSSKPITVTVRFLLTISLLLAPAFSPLALHAGSKSTPKTGIKLLDAVKTTLEKQPDIHIMRQEVEHNRGALQEAKGQFDPVVSLSGGHDYTEESQPVLSGLSETKEDITSLTFKLSKKYRSGVEISPNIALTRTDSPDEYQEIQNTAGINLTFTVPLMRGLGKEATGAEEMAAEREYEYRLHQMRHTTWESVFNTVLKYWAYQSATKRLDLLKVSESRAKSYVRDIRALINADELPAAELENMLANLESKTASRIAREQALYEAKQNLGLAMGLQFEAIDVLPLPSDDFPEVNDKKEIPFIQKEAMIKNALASRDDYLASKELQKSKNILLKAARNELKSKLDLSFNAGYSGLKEGSNASNFITSTRSNIPGVSASILLICELPYGNRAARGMLLQRKSEYEKHRIATNNLARNITSKIAVAFSAYKNSKRELIKARKSAHYYKKALKNEREKVKLGTATLLDLIEVERRLTNTLLDEISAHLKYAVALARHRFETGTMMTGDGEDAYIDTDQLITLPVFKDRKK